MKCLGCPNWVARPTFSKKELGRVFCTFWVNFVRFNSRLGVGAYGLPDLGVSQVSCLPQGLLWTDQGTSLLLGLMASILVHWVPLTGLKFVDVVSETWVGSAFLVSLVDEVTVAGLS